MAARHKPAVTLWLIAERKRLGWKPEELSRRLKDAGYQAEVSTVRVWESGRTPAAETVEGLEKLFGSTAPRETEQGYDMPALFAKMDRQTDAIESVANALLELITRMDGAQSVAREEREQIAELLGVVARAQSPEEMPAESEPSRPGQRRR